MTTVTLKFTLRYFQNFVQKINFNLPVILPQLIYYQLVQTTHSLPKPRVEMIFNAVVSSNIKRRVPPWKLLRHQRPLVAHLFMKLEQLLLLLLCPVNSLDRTIEMIVISTCYQYNLYLHCFPVLPGRPISPMRLLIIDHLWSP